MRMSAKQSYGHKGELWALAEFQARGYDARLISQWTDKYDIVLNGVLPVEVKRSRSYMRKVRCGYYMPTWCFDTARIAQAQDYLLLLIVEDEFNQFWPYLVASCFVQGRQTIAITSHPRRYKGFWADSLNRWSVIDWLIHIRQRLNQPLLLMGTGDNSTETPEWGQFPTQERGSKNLSPFPIGAQP